MALLEDHARRHVRFMMWLILGFGALFGSFGVIVAVARFHPPPDVSERVLYSGILLLGAGLFAREARRRPGKAEPGLRALAERPQDIVWCYGFSSKRGTELVLATIEGVRLGVPIPHRRADALLRETAARLPHAVAGYRPEIDERYRRDPRTLRLGTA
jgi:hypothetical protein